jgi:NAD(P)-dependent dehydrogenase (short-subunit alcohol dehydrogenase family)
MSEVHQTTLVTGATSDIGKSICEALAVERDLILSDRDPGALAEARRSLPRAERHHVWPTDLMESGTLAEGLGGFLKANQLAVSSFVHVAGVCTVAPLRLLDQKMVRRMFEVNILSVFEIGRILVSRKCNERHLLNMVFVASIAPILGTPGFSGYAASKGALVALARSLAVELAPGVRVNCVAPGGIMTRGTRLLNSDTEAQQRETAEYPLGEGRCTDITDAVSFLLSERARWITGQQLIVDGGRTLR